MQEITDSILMFVTFLQEISGIHLNSYTPNSNLLVTASCFACYCGYFNNIQYSKNVYALHRSFHIDRTLIMTCRSDSHEIFPQQVSRNCLQQDNLLLEISRFLETEETKTITFKSSSTSIILCKILPTYYYLILN
jgi:hypothetical protein